MAKTRMALEIGMGTSLRKGDYTRAAVRAVQDAVWRNSISFAEAFGFEKSDMLIDVEIGVQKPDAVDGAEVKAVLPYGNGGVRVVRGGLDIPKPDGDGVTILANAAIVISFDMERRTDTPGAGMEDKAVSP
ncbi:MAG: Lin0512 family protein [Rhodobiaceae bacterium]|jgi:uncharacterized protein (TIGR02058 family)